MTLEEWRGARSGLSSVGLRHFTKLLVASTLVLIFLGGQVKSNNAGLAVPDWPTSFGVNMFLFHWSNWVGGIFHEHLHRLVASFVGFLTLVLVGWLSFREAREWVRLLGFVALVVVILQGVLGGLTVIFMLPTAVSVSHAVLAQTFFVVVIVVAYSQSQEYAGRIRCEPPESPQVLMRPALMLCGVVFLQLILGALMRHTESGLAIPDFPSTAGRWVPWFGEDTLSWINAWRANYSIDHEQYLGPVVMGQVLVHFGHRVGAAVVCGVVVYYSVMAFRQREENRSAWRLAAALIGCLVLQVGLGASTIWTQKTPIVASFHVAVGAALLGLGALAVLRVFPYKSEPSGGVAKAATT